jgi:hypothetical protein
MLRVRWAVGQGLRPAQVEPLMPRRMPTLDAQVSQEEDASPGLRE